VDVVDHASLFLERTPYRQVVRRGILKPLTKVAVDLLKVGALATVIATEFTGDEADAGGDQHP
jgi:hypothetical protein